MDYARDLHSGKVVAAEDASLVRSYACPRPGCGGRVYLPDVVVQRPHFRHYPGEGTPACDEYFPGSAGSGERGTRATAAVEEDPSELGLLLTQLDGRWGLGLRLPEIPSKELGETSLGALRSALVDVYAGRDRLLRVSALDLRPGVGAARVDVVPSLQLFRTQPGGSWPASIHKDRWLLESRGFEAKGALFRLRLGEWMRLLAGSGVHHGETLLALADARCAPPDSIVSETHARISSGGMQWTIWEVQLPSKPVAGVVGWLARLGHEFVQRPWSVDLATPPRAYGERGEPVFWVGDSPVLMLEAPQPAGVAMIAFQSGSNSHGANVRATDGRFAHVSVSVRDAGLTRLAVAGERTASLDLAFIELPPPTSLCKLLLQTPRLRIQIGQQSLEAWQGTTHKVRVLSREQPLVRVDLGDESVRTRVTVFERGKQRSKRGLDSRGAARAIEDSLASADRVEVDADNLGRIVLLPVRAAVDATREAKAGDRLAWRNHVVSLCSHTEERHTPTLFEQPRVAKSLAARQVAPASLVHSRMAIRRRLESRGSRS